MRWLCGRARNGLPAGAQSVRVEFFKNETLEPRLVVAVNRALKPGCNRMAPTLWGGQRGLVVTGELTEFLPNWRELYAWRFVVGQRLQHVLTAHQGYPPSTGEVVYEGDITGNSTVRVGNDLTAGQRQAVPIIADHLARQATSLIVDGKWPEAAAAAP